jgi:hypothetical protein
MSVVRNRALMPRHAFDEQSARGCSRRRFFIKKEINFVPRNQNSCGTEVTGRTLAPLDKLFCGTEVTGRTLCSTRQTALLSEFRGT